MKDELKAETILIIFTYSYKTFSSLMYYIILHQSDKKVTLLINEG